MNNTNNQLQSETFPTDLSQSPKNHFSKDHAFERFNHSSQIKRPKINFDENDPNSNLFDVNICQGINQSFNTINNYSLTQISKNVFNNENNILNNDNNNILNYKKSLQQEKYDYIKNYCLKKNDPDSYPLISYENYLMIDSLCEKSTSEYEPYKNFLFNKSASIELFSKFCTLLMNRQILSKLKKYPKVVYQIIFDVNNIYNYLSPDIVADAKQSNMFISLVNFENVWNVLVVYQNSNLCNYYMFNKNMDKEIISTIMTTITQAIYPYNKFTFSASDYSGFSDSNQVILPFIIMDFFSRYKNNLPIDDEDFYYQTILILSEILNNKLITK